MAYPGRAPPHDGWDCAVWNGCGDRAPNIVRNGTSVERHLLRGVNGRRRSAASSPRSETYSPGTAEGVLPPMLESILGMISVTGEQQTAVPPLGRIRSLLRAELPRLEGDYAVATLEIFGSYVRDQATTDSDLDLLVEFVVPPSLFRFQQLEDELSELLGVPVDLVMKDCLKPHLGQRILAEAVPV